MSDNSDKLKEIFDNDFLGLLAETPVEKEKQQGTNDRLLSSFIEISEFFEEHGKAPEFSSDIGEYKLASRLNAIKKDPKKVKHLIPFDYYNLLEQEKTKSISVDELLKYDPLNLLNPKDIDQSIFNLSHVKKSDRLRPDYIAHRKICKNFDEYEAMFKKIHEDLKNGDRKLIEFKEQDLQVGNFYVLRGVVFFLEENFAIDHRIDFDSGAKTRKDGRTRCIFDNGTESTMLYRSLVKAMNIDGFGISSLIKDDKETQIIDSMDIQNGYIYVLRSLSLDPQIKSIHDLYKIGYCSGDVTDRIKNARHEPTYLMNDVEIVLTVRCYNLNVPYLESSIHSFFKEVNVYFEIKDEKGNYHYPKEWFVVPLNVIEEVVPLIVNGKIDNYKYNKDLKIIIKKAD